SPDCLPAAVAGGADAVYLGLRHFNARGRAENFRLSDLPQQIAYLHHHQLKAYVVMNTLMHDDEFPKAVRMAAEAHAAGVDAFLIQDLGLWQCLQQEIPDIEVHASTQMTVHTCSQVDFLAQRGARRIVVARELDLHELQKISAHAAALNVEIEHFVHGALCYAMSGQCLMSNFSGCRSANRGTCAQNCRFDYVMDGKLDGKEDTHISMKDLSLIERVGDLADAGVASLKIEGRLKGPEYVYTVSSAFRAAVDAWKIGGDFAVKNQREKLNMVFSRGHSDAPLDGVYDQRSRLHRFDVKPETQFGTLVSCQRKSQQVIICSPQKPQAGQGFVIRLEKFNDGFLITHVKAEGRKNHWQCAVRIQLHGPAVPVGSAIVLNADQQLKRDVQQAMQQKPLHDIEAPRQPLHINLRGKISEPLLLQLEFGSHHIEVRSEQNLETASTRGLDAERMQQSLAALGGTAYTCEQIAADWDVLSTLFIPAKILKIMRREMVVQLDQIVATHKDEVGTENIQGHGFQLREQQSVPQRQTKIIAAVRTLAAAQAALQAGASSVWLENWPDTSLPLDVGDKVGAQAVDKIVLRLSPMSDSYPDLDQSQAIVAGHWGQIAAYQSAQRHIISDHYCNGMNSLTLQALADAGVSAAVLSLECSAREVARLATRCQSANMPELILCVHGRLPSMLSRQDHGIKIGEQAHMKAASHDGSLPYEVEARSEHETWIWEARRLCAPQEAQASAGIVDHWLLELGAEDPAYVQEICALYV
ncbi:MAG: U32 family peptidase, partial [Planctomycetes bacterium]|nr:U32 family peptidase [Planctomycetota bacterium]